MSKSNMSPARPGVAGDWLTPGRFALALALLIFAAFPQVLLGWQTFVVRDFGFFAYPLAHYQRECFWRGELPLWNPYNNCGVPFLAQWNTMPLYPPALIYLVLPLSWALGFFCLLHLFFAGFGMYCLSLRWTGNRLAAAVAGVIFAFNGFTLNLLMWPSHIATLAWMPWVILTVEQAWEEGGRKIPMAALAGALQMLAGGPETILFTWLILLALWSTELLKSRCSSSIIARSPSLPRVPPAVWRFPVVVALVAGLAAAQLLPFLDLAAHSQREQGYADTRWSMPGWGWANFLVPMVFGSIWNNGLFFQHEQAWTSSYYLGVGALLLALIGVLTVRRRRVLLLSLAAALALVFSFGNQTFVYRSLRHLLPQLSMVTYPIKFVALIALAAPLLAAFGITRIQGLQLEDRRGLVTRLIFLGSTLFALIAAILLWAWRFPFLTDNFSATLGSGLTRAVFLAVVMIALLALALNIRPAVQRILPPVLIAALWLDVMTHEPPQNPTVAPWIYAPALARTKLALQPQPALGQSRVMVSPAAERKFMQFVTRDLKDNFLVKRLGYFADCNLLDDVPKVNGFFSLYPRESGELTSLLYTSANVSFASLADFMSVSQISSPKEFFDWVPRATFLPLATAGQRPVCLDDTNALYALVQPGFDARTVVILPSNAGTCVSVTNHTTARVVPGRFMAERIELETDALEPSLVVLAQTYYHLWHASVDNRPALVLRANYAFQAVEVPAGRHFLRFVYQDSPFLIGACISGLSLVISLVILAVSDLRQSRRLEMVDHPKPVSR